MNINRLWKLIGLLGIASFLGARPARGQAPTLEQALDATNLVWITGGDVSWFGETTNSYDGNSAAATVLNGHNQTSWLETLAVGPATLSFWHKQVAPSGFPFPSSPFLSFTVNPEGPHVAVPVSLGGSSSWGNAIYDLPAGTNVLHWIFSASASATNGLASAFIDQVTLGPPRPLQITSGPFDQTVFARQPVGLFVSAIGTPPLTYQWFKDGTNVPGATNTSLYFDSPSTNDTGVYSVVVSNVQDFVTSTNAQLTVLPPAPPSIEWPPEDLTVYSGQSFTWSVYAEGSPPFSFQWLKNGTNLPGATAAYLSVTNVQLTDAGVYSVEVSNSEGSVLSSNAVVTVLPSAAPLITSQPCSMNVAAGASPVLSVQATGTPDPQYEWFKNGTNLPGVHFSSISFSNITAADAGVYSVRVHNFAAAVWSRPAIVQVFDSPSLRSWWPHPVDAVFVTNDLAYLAQGTNGVGILDVSDPENPVLVGSCSTPDPTSAIQVEGTSAYVAAGSSVQVLRVTNPTDPVLVGSFRTADYVSGVFVVSNRAYVAATAAGLQILDVSDPTHPFRLGVFATNMYPAAVCVVSNVAYVGCPAYLSPIDNPIYPGLQILDVSNPAQPVLLSTTSSDVESLDLRSNIVLTAGVNTGLSLFDVSDPTSPASIGSLYFMSLFTRLSPWDVHVAGKLAYVAGGSDGLWVFDVTLPSNPVVVGHFYTAGFAAKVAVVGNRAYVALGDAGLQIVDLPPNLGIQPSPTLSLSQSNGLTLRLDGPIGAPFAVEFLDDLNTGVWQPLQTLTLANGAALLEVNPTTKGQRFFRARPLAF